MPTHNLLQSVYWYCGALLLIVRNDHWKRVHWYLCRKYYMEMLTKYSANPQAGGFVMNGEDK